MTLGNVKLSSSDIDMCVQLAGCSLATKSGDKDNWIEEAGGLPEY